MSDLLLAVNGETSRNRTASIGKKLLSQKIANTSSNTSSQCSQSAAFEPGYGLPAGMSHETAAQLEKTICEDTNDSENSQTVPDRCSRPSAFEPGYGLPADMSDETANKIEETTCENTSENTGERNHTLPE